MALTGKLESEVELQSPATKFFNVFATQIHDLQNVSDVVHNSKLHQGDWHGIGSHSVKHWTLLVDGKVQIVKEHFEDIDHESKTITFNLFDGDVISNQYKTLKATLKVSDKGSGSVAHWTYVYEKLHEGIPPPQEHLDVATKVTKDVDAYLNKTT